MKALIQKHGRTAGGLFGIVAAIAFWFDPKAAGIVLAACAVLLVGSTERARKLS